MNKCAKFLIINLSKICKLEISEFIKHVSVVLITFFKLANRTKKKLLKRVQILLQYPKIICELLLAYKINFYWKRNG